jgi:flagellar biosynthetic protein FlhB
MADPGRTENATPKRREEARERGQVARSIELNSVIVLLTALLTFRYAGPYMIDSMNQLAVFSYQNMNTSLGMETVYSFGLFYMWIVFKIIAPVLAAILTVGLMSNYLQIGVMFSLKPLMPKLSNVNPISGFSKLFSRRSLVEFFKSLIKLFLIGWVVYVGVKNALPDLVPTMDMQGAGPLEFVGKLTMKILDRAILALFVLRFLIIFINVGNTMKA